MLEKEFDDYKSWCRKYNLKENDAKNLYLYANKEDFGFIFGDVKEYEDELTSDQLKAVYDL